ncbi:hypothetical protein GW17_00033254, partial [Ensete ventricosum]
PDTLALGTMAFVDADKLSYEIFSILESKFLFGLDDPNKLFFPTSSSYSSAGASPRTAARAGGRIRILSIDGGGSPSDALLAAVALARLESSLRRRSGDPSARVADMFDVAAGSGAGGVLVAMLFTRDHDGRPLFSATDALHLLLSESRRRRGRGFSSRRGLFRGMFRRPGSFFRRIFGDATLRDTVKPVLIPCYDLATGAPFLFSRADAVEADGYDFRMWEVCAATCADASTAAVDLRSVDGRTRVTAVGAGVAMANPVAAAITHVLHNKPEFPFAAGVEDLMVVSLGASAPAPAAPCAAEFVRIAGEGFSDMVDQAVGMAFGRPDGWIDCSWVASAGHRIHVGELHAKDDELGGGGRAGAVAATRGVAALPRSRKDLGADQRRRARPVRGGAREGGGVEEEGPDPDGGAKASDDTANVVGDDRDHGHCYHYYFYEHDIDMRETAEQRWPLVHKTVCCGF